MAGTWSAAGRLFTIHANGTVVGNTFLQFPCGDTYAIALAGVAFTQRRIASALLMVKASLGDADPGLLAPATLPDPDGTLGSYGALWILRPDQTAILTPGIYRWEIRLTTIDGQEDTPIRAARLRTTKRLIQSF